MTPFVLVPNPAWKATPAPSAFVPAKKPENAPPAAAPLLQGPVQLTLLNLEPNRALVAEMPEVPFIWKVLPATVLVAFKLIDRFRFTNSAVRFPLFSVPP